mgnify:CR=1 FL=1
MIFPLFSSIFANTCGKPLSRTIKKNSRLDRLNGFSSRYECEQNAKIVCFFVTQNSFLLVAPVRRLHLLTSTKTYSLLTTGTYYG